MNDEQIRMIAKLTKDDAIALYNAGEVWTWVSICKVIQEVARAGTVLPLNVLQFYWAIGYDPRYRRHYIGQC